MNLIALGTISILFSIILTQLNIRGISPFSCNLPASRSITNMQRAKTMFTRRISHLFRKRLLDVSGIIERFNVYVTLAIMPRKKDINKAFWLVHICIKTPSFPLLGRRISLLYHVYKKNFALLQITFIPETSIVSTIPKILQ